MARVMDLLPGDLVTMDGASGVFISAGPHPQHGLHLQLVIWWLMGSRFGPAGWSLDALRPGQEIGDVTPSTPSERWERVRSVFK